jgi:WD40 repeat protein
LIRSISSPGKLWSGLAFSRDGRRLVGTNAATGLHLWEVETGATLLNVNLPGKQFSGPAFGGKEGGLLLAASWQDNDAAVHVWDPGTGRELRKLAVSEGIATDLAVSPDGRWVAASTNSSTVRVFEVETGKQRTPVRSPAGSVTTLGFSPDGRALAAGTQGGSVVIWDAATGEKTQQFPAHPNGTYSLDFSPDGLRIATRGVDLTVNIWDVRTGQRLLGLPLGTAGIRRLFFSADGLRLFVADQWRVLVWDTESSGERRTLHGHLAPIRDAAWSPDGNLVVTPAEDGTVRLWDARTGSCLHVVDCAQQPSNCWFHKDGRSVMVSFENGPNRVWDVESGREIPLTSPAEYRVHSPISPDGKYVVSLDGRLASIVPIDPIDEREESRRRLITAPDPIWHADRATRSERVGVNFAAAFHLERVLKADPWNAALWLRHGRAASRAGMTEKAAVSYLRSVLLDSQVGKR